MGFARVGLFGFGGGPSMLPLMQRECVGAGWVSEEQFLEGLAIGNSLPGPIATKMALFVGYEAGGVSGAVAALLGVLLPSSVLLALLAGVLLKNRDNPYVAGALTAVKPVIVGMLAFVAFDLAPSGVQGSTGAVLALVAFGALVWGAHPGWVIAASAAFGAVALR